MHIELLAFVLSAALVVYLYSHLLMPLINGKLEFIYGDFTSIINVNSGAVRTYSSDGRTLDLYTLLRTEKLAEIENYTKLDPTRWEVYICAQKPFLLTFAETYVPNWKVYIYK
ncbi:MAG: hypothetical protein ACO2PN_24605 [Pyrobaculum sp.]